MEYEKEAKEAYEKEIDQMFKKISTQYGFEYTQADVGTYSFYTLKTNDKSISFSTIVNRGNIIFAYEKGMSTKVKKDDLKDMKKLEPLIKIINDYLKE